MSYNTDFLIAAMIIQLIILCHFSAQKRPDDLNNQLFLILSVLVSLDIAFEVLSTFYINFEHAGPDWAQCLQQRSSTCSRPCCLSS